MRNSQPELHRRAGNQAMAVVAQCVVLWRSSLAVLPLEVAVDTAVATVLEHKALVPGPGLDLRAIHAEVLTREQVALRSNGAHLVEELL
jgi:hypothetical protein